MSMEYDLVSHFAVLDFGFVEVMIILDTLMGWVQHSTKKDMARSLIFVARTIKKKRTTLGVTNALRMDEMVSAKTTASC